MYKSNETVHKTRWPCYIPKKKTLFFVTRTLKLMFRREITIDFQNKPFVSVIEIFFRFSVT